MTVAAGDPMLICYDGSDGARHAIDVAGSLFAGRRALVLSVWTPFSSMYVGYPLAVWPAIDSAPLRDRAEALAAEGSARAHAAGLAASPLVAEAVAGVAATINDVADDNAAALTVMGTRGLSGIRSVVLGSVSHAVAQHTHRPLLVVPSAPLAAARAQSVNSVRSVVATA
jgi:nucleotide-binding universal stress UspA family protein